MSEPEEGEAFEIEVQNWDTHKLDRGYFIPDDTKLRLLVKSAPVGNCDESTAPTTALTDVDEMSLREKFSFGSLSLNDTGTFHTHDYDNPTMGASRHSWRVLSNRGNPFSIGESNGSSFEQNRECQDKSLFDVDLDDDDQNVINASSLGIKLADDSIHKSRSVEFVRKEYALRSEGNVPSKSHFVDLSPSSKSTFATETLRTGSRVEFYRVSCSETEEPLSCQQKLVQPALNCDEDLWDSKQLTGSLQQKGVQRNGEHISDVRDGIGSKFLGFFCDQLCFMPTKP